LPHRQGARAQAAEAPAILKFFAVAEIFLTGSLRGAHMHPLTYQSIGPAWREGAHRTAFDLSEAEGVGELAHTGDGVGSYDDAVR
jgi:hypothetical protein